MSIHFYDAANPENISSGVYAGVYANGYAWPLSDVKRMSRIFHISVLSESYWARVARCLDIENGAARPIDLPPFVKVRRAHGFNDATGYVNRSNWMAAWLAMKNADEPEPLWWVSTLDGTQDVKLEDDNGMVLAEAWAVQYYGGIGKPYDLSVLHGYNNFVKP